MAKCHEDLCLGRYSQPRQSCFRDLVDNCYILDASLWMREGILRQGVSSAGTRQWTSTATGEVKSSIQISGGNHGLGPHRPPDLQPREERPRFEPVVDGVTWARASGSRRCAGVSDSALCASAPSSISGRASAAVALARAIRAESRAEIRGVRRRRRVSARAVVDLGPAHVALAVTCSLSGAGIRPAGLAGQTECRRLRHQWPLAILPVRR